MSMWISMFPVWLTGLALPAWPTAASSGAPPAARSEAAPIHARAVKTVEGTYFRVVCHFENGTVAQEALKIAEAVWPWAERLYGEIDEPLDLPEVHLYRTREDYEIAEQRLTGGYFRRNLAFSHWNSRTAHILLQPVLPEASLELVGLPYQTRYLISHESAHLARFLSLDNYRFHPRWLADGTASWIDENVMRELGWLGHPEDDPTLSTYMVLAQRLLHRERLPAPSEFLTGRAPTLDFYDTYAVHYLLFRYLQTLTGPGLFDDVIAKLRQTNESRQLPAELAKFLRGARNADDWRSIDQGFQRYVRGLTPRWNQPFNVLETHGEDWVQVAFENNPATSWHLPPIGAQAWNIRGIAELLPHTRNMAVLIDQKLSGFFAIEFQRDGVQLLDEVGNRTPVPVAGTRLSLKDEFEFAIRYDRGELVVEIDGETVLKHELDQDAEDHYWGLRVGPGGAGVWRSIGLETL